MNDGKVARTADAITALFIAYEPPAVIFFKTLDNILIALGDPFGLRVTALNDRSITFDTLSGDNFGCGEREVVLGNVVGIVVLRPHRGGEDQSRRAQAIEQATRFITELSAALTEAEAKGTISAWGQCLQAGLAAATNSGATIDAPGNGVTEPEAKAQLEEFFERVEAFLNRPNYRFQLPAVAGASPCPRFLFFHRYVGQSGRPTVRLHLLSSQRARLAAHVAQMNATGGELKMPDLESALGEALAADHWDVESSFRSGVTSWIDWPWQHAHANELPPAVDTAQGIVTAFAGGAVAGSASSDIGPGAASALVAPVHVDGLPWLALAAILPHSDASEKTWAQYFYRDLLPYLTTTIRAAAERVYLREVGKLAIGALNAGKSTVEEITDALAPLASTFPYSKVVVSRTGSDVAFHWGGSDAYVTPGRLGFDAGRVAYNRLDREGIVAALIDAQDKFDAAKMKHIEERMSSYVDIGHTLKNLVSSTGWAAAAQQVAIVHRNFDVLERQGLTASAIARIRTALSFADRSLSLFWTVEGLGHFIRLAGAQSGKFEWSKFSSWVDESCLSSDGVDAQVLDSYARGVRMVAQAICFGWGWTDLTVMAEGGEPFVWSGSDPPTFTIGDLHFPPFRKGSDGGFAIVFCLVEPIVNAVRALGALPSSSPLRRDPASLQISVSHDPDDRDAVVVTVINLSLHPLPEKLSGLESTKNMMRDMGIGRFDPTPPPTQLANGMYEITNRVRFHPKTIADAILQSNER